MNPSKSLIDSTNMKSLVQDDVRNKSSKMTTMYGHDQVQPRQSLSMKSLQGDESSTCDAQNKLVASTANKQRHTSHTFANGLKEQVKGKLSLGAKLLRVGSMKKVFNHIFSLSEGEQLLKTSECCLSTTAGPIAGLLFISSDKLAFCSHTPIIKLSSPTGELLRFHYKVVIPLTKIERANQRESMVKKTSKKYLQLNTTDEFEFWFMGFRNYNKMFRCLQHVISQALDSSHI
ncbi:GEM-like protein 4 [Bienertia sinuspersici]